MIRFLVFLLIVWVVLSVLGFVIEGLIWLAIVGLVLFAATTVFLWIKRKASSGTPPPR
ncbi:MAG TPA: LPXTG cell wall anchor domain-containing protein [Beutenbergiaceae bacterium]|nr:LPXTG cell wall anchor domain-containing protein [Beutenbergiaceae bacterium]